MTKTNLVWLCVFTWLVTAALGLVALAHAVQGVLLWKTDNLAAQAEWAHATNWGLALPVLLVVAFKIGRDVKDYDKQDTASVQQRAARPHRR